MRPRRALAGALLGLGAALLGRAAGRGLFSGPGRASAATAGEPRARSFSTLTHQSGVNHKSIFYICSVLKKHYFEGDALFGEKRCEFELNDLNHFLKDLFVEKKQIAERFRFQILIFLKLRPREDF